jgi:probable phosphoglycerate mutase
MTARGGGELFAIRHGETEWSRSGRHTGRTDIPLNEAGRRAAKAIGRALSTIEISRALSSPLQRARDTCELAGLADRMDIDPDLVEWDYGDYEGLTPEEIQRRAPGWLIFVDGCPGGERPAEVKERVDRVIARVRATSGRVAVFAHGHLLRALTARWIELPLTAACHFLLDTATLTELAYYRGIPALRRWNVPVFEGR